MNRRRIGRTVIVVFIIIFTILGFLKVYDEYVKLKEAYEKQFNPLLGRVIEGEHLIVLTDVSRSIADNLRYWILVKPPIYPAWAYPTPPAVSIGIKNITFVYRADMSSLEPDIRFDGLLISDTCNLVNIPNDIHLTSFRNLDITTKVSGFYRDPEGRWITIGFRVYGILLNRRALVLAGLQNVTSILDLYKTISSNTSYLKPGLIVLSSSTVAATQFFVLRVIEKYGWDTGWKILYLIGGLANITARKVDAITYVALGLNAITIGSQDDVLLALSLSRDVEFLVNEESILEPLLLAPVESPVSSYFENLVLWFISDEGQRSILMSTDYLPVIPLTNESRKLEYQKIVESVLASGKGNILDYYPIRVCGSFTRKAILVIYQTLIEDPELNSVLKYIFRKLAEIGDSTVVDQVLSYLAMPYEITDPISRRTVNLTIEYIVELNEKIASSDHDQALLTIRQELEQKAKIRYTSIISLLETISE